MNVFVNLNVNNLKKVFFINMQTLFLSLAKTDNLIIKH